jgi:hypothetical protein
MLSGCTHTLLLAALFLSSDAFLETGPSCRNGEVIPTGEYPPNWEDVSRRVKERARWQCELCGAKNGPSPNVLTVHHLDGDKWNLLSWNLAALCQRCHLRVQATFDFYQTALMGVYPRWLQVHVKGYNGWAEKNGRTQLALSKCD